MRALAAFVQRWAIGSPDKWITASAPSRKFASIQPLATSMPPGPRVRDFKARTS
jgi:hypothetical protein